MTRARDDLEISCQSDRVCHPHRGMDIIGEDTGDGITRHIVGIHGARVTVLIPRFCVGEIQHLQEQIAASRFGNRPENSDA